MPSPVLWPIAGAAALNLGRRAAEALTEGLSFAAQLARQQPDDVNEPGARATSQRADFEERISRLVARISQRLSAAGLMLSQPVHVISDGLAGLTISSDHPQRAAIEDALATDVLLTRDFDRLAEQYREQTGGELHISVE